MLKVVIGSVWVATNVMAINVTIPSSQVNRFLRLILTIAQSYDGYPNLVFL